MLAAGNFGDWHAPVGEVGTEDEQTLRLGPQKCERAIKAIALKAASNLQSRTESYKQLEILDQAETRKAGE